MKSLIVYLCEQHVILVDLGVGGQLTPEFPDGIVGIDAHADANLALIYLIREEYVNE